MFSDIPAEFVVSVRWSLTSLLGSLVNVTCLFYTDNHISYCLIICKLQ